MNSPTRRRFVQTFGGFVATFLTPGWSAAKTGATRRRLHLIHMYRWSGRGRRASKAALLHAANRRYATKKAALRDVPHPGANLRLVRLDTTLHELFRLFVRERSLVADLRHLR